MSNNFIKLRNRLITRSRLSISLTNLNTASESKNLSLYNEHSCSHNEISIVSSKSSSNESVNTNSSLNKSSLCEFFDSKLDIPSDSSSVILIDSSNPVDFIQKIKQEYLDFSISLENKIKSRTMEKDDINYVLKFVPTLNDKDGLHKFCKCADRVWGPFKEKKDNDTVKIKRKLMDIFVSKLEGKAYDVVRYKDFDDWLELKKALEAKFIKRRSKGLVSVELISCKQINDVRSFANMIEKLLGELNDICITAENVDEDNVDIITQLNESTPLSSFQNGLNSSLRTIVKSRNPQDLSSAIAIALEEEASFKPNISNKSSIICNFCKKNGHYANSCFKKNRNSFNQQNNSHSQSNTNGSSQNSNQRSNNFQNSNQRSNNLQNSRFQNKNSFQNSQLPETSTFNQNQKQGSFKSTSFNSNIHNASVICSYCKNSNHNFQNCWKRKFKNLQRSLNNDPNEPSNSSTDILNLNPNEPNSENSNRTQQDASTPTRVHNLSA